MGSQKVAGLVLPREAASSVDAQVFSGFPGVYTPGEPVAIESLGLTRDEARELLKELDLPLKEARADAPAEEDPEPVSAAEPAVVEEGEGE